MKEKSPNTSKPKLIKLKSSALKFLEEAEYCSTCQYRKEEDSSNDNVLGLAALGLCFSVMVTIGEVIKAKNLPKKKDGCPQSSDGRAIRKFLGYMHKEKWLLTKLPKGVSGIDAGEILTRTRNGFIHHLSMPNDIIILYDKSKFPAAKQNIGLDLAEFVKDVRSGLNEILKNFGDQPIAAGPNSDYKGVHIITGGSVCSNG